jgi:hypothetical protein
LPVNSYHGASSRGDGHAGERLGVRQIRLVGAGHDDFFDALQERSGERDQPLALFGDRDATTGDVAFAGRKPSNRRSREVGISATVSGREPSLKVLFTLCSSARVVSAAVP